MEQMNSTQSQSPSPSPAVYGVNVVEYGGGGGDHVGTAGSMMALMTQHEPEMTSVVPSTSFPCYNHAQSDQCLLSAAMFQSSQPNKHHPHHILGGGGHFAMDHFQTAVISDSSMSSVKTETCSPLPTQFELIGTKDERRLFYAEPSFVGSPHKEGDNHNHGHGPHSQGCSSSCKQNEADAIKTKIMAHIHYPRLLTAYVDCQKVGAPPEVVTELNELSKKCQDRESLPSISIGADPELDQFMEAYCELFMKLQEELAKPFKEAMAFLKKVEAQLGPLSNGPLRRSPSGEGEERGMSSGDGEDDGSGGEMEYQDMEVDPHAEDRELKDQLLRKYSGYLSSLKQEFLKKKKKGKLPKEARQKLLEWWTAHYKWPYPSEAQKIALAESTGLDQKQINNWFINQRKRHWKPTEEMQFVVMDGSNPHAASLYLDAGHLRADGSTFTMDC